MWRKTQKIGGEKTPASLVFLMYDQTIWNVSKKVKDTILNCGLTSGNRAPIVNIDECQVLFCTIDVIEKKRFPGS